jgi:hypothetical protein
MSTKTKNTTTISTENTEAKHAVPPVAATNAGELSAQELQMIVGGDSEANDGFVYAAPE